MYLIVNGVYINPYSSLLKAIQNNYSNEILQILIIHGCKLDVKNSDGETPISILIKNKNEDLLEYIIGHCSTLKEKLHISKSLFISAINNCSLNFVKYLIDHGAKYCTNFFDNHLEDPLFSAMKTGNLNLIQYLTKNSTNDDKNYLKGIFCIKYIAIAFQNNYNNIIKYLIKTEKNLNRLFLHDNILVDAIQYNHLNIIKLLITHGINPNKVNNKNQLPLTVAIKNKNFEIIKYLIRHGANPNYQANAETPLTCATVQKNLDIIEYLLEHGADINKSIDLADTNSSNSYKSAAQVIKYNMEHGTN
eukprot:jgi/Orpsp1_1/1181694/evm.model.c7180000078229.1